MGNCAKYKRSKKVKIDQKNEVDENLQKTINGFTINGKKSRMDLVGQDTFQIQEFDSFRFYGVFDGHGIKGREASMLVNDFITRNLLSERNFGQYFKSDQLLKDYFSRLYARIQSEFMSNMNDYELSGSCAICVLQSGTRVSCINLGDSRCVIGARKNGKKTSIEMSLDHKPIREDEIKRISEQNGQVDLKGGVPRIIKKNDEIPGLAVSRTLGDIVGHECGVSYIPEIISKELDAEDVFIVAGSDGIWDIMSNTEVVGFVFYMMEQYPNNPEVISKLLVEECRYRWELLNLFKEKYFLENIKVKSEETLRKNVYDIDDITACVYFFDLKFDDE